LSPAEPERLSEKVAPEPRSANLGRTRSKTGQPGPWIEPSTEGATTRRLWAWLWRRSPSLRRSERSWSFSVSACSVVGVGDRGLLKNYETKNLNDFERWKLAALPWWFAADPMGCGPFVSCPRYSSVAGSTPLPPRVPRTRDQQPKWLAVFHSL